MANRLILIACFISYKKWVQREKYPNSMKPYTELTKLGLQTVLTCPPKM